MLVEAFTVVENIILGSETTKHGVLDLKKASQDILDLSKKYGLAVDPNAKVEDISVGAQQRVEILKTLYRGADILIFDEPTRGIDVGAKDEIYTLLENLAQQGKAIIVISSELPEVLRLANRIAVMAHGRIIGTLDNEEATQENIMELATVGQEEANGVNA